MKEFGRRNPRIDKGELAETPDAPFLSIANEDGRVSRPSRGLLEIVAAAQMFLFFIAAGIGYLYLLLYVGYAALVYFSAMTFCVIFMMLIFYLRTRVATDNHKIIKLVANEAFVFILIAVSVLAMNIVGDRSRAVSIETPIHRIGRCLKNQWGVACAIAIVPEAYRSPINSGTKSCPLTGPQLRKVSIGSSSDTIQWHPGLFGLSWLEEGCILKF